MINSELENLRGSPFDALRALLEPLEPAKGLTPMTLTIGEPQHKPPQLMLDALHANEHLYGKYPPAAGTAEQRQAIEGWLKRRFGLSESIVGADKNIAPVNGTREALFMIAQVITERAGHNEAKPAILLPTPYYHTYHAAAFMAGAEPVFMPATKETRFFPDLTGLDPELLDRTTAFYLCSPANPQGTAADWDYLENALRLAIKHDFILIMDECYTEIYDKEPPVGILEVCDKLGEGLNHVLSFHSLSKRSSAAGLRSGFCTGNQDIIQSFIDLRNYAGAVSPLPVCAAAAALWNDDTHVEENRMLYRQKFDAAERIIGDRFSFYRPDGGFFLWLDVGDGIEATKQLWTRGALRVLPGHFLSAYGPDGSNPGDAYIRVALVGELAPTEEALTRLVNSL